MPYTGGHECETEENHRAERFDTDGEQSDERMKLAADYAARSAASGCNHVLDIVRRQRTSTEDKSRRQEQTLFQS